MRKITTNWLFLSFSCQTRGFAKSFSYFVRWVCSTTHFSPCVVIPVVASRERTGNKLRFLINDSAREIFINNDSVDLIVFESNWFLTIARSSTRKCKILVLCKPLKLDRALCVATIVKTRIILWNWKIMPDNSFFATKVRFYAFLSSWRCWFWGSCFTRYYDFFCCPVNFIIFIILLTFDYNLIRLYFDRTHF